MNAPTITTHHLTIGHPAVEETMTFSIDAAFERAAIALAKRNFADLVLNDMARHTECEVR